MREITLDGTWGDSADTSTRKPISELEKMVKAHRGWDIPLKTISRGGDLPWLFEAPRLDANLIVTRAHARGVLVPPSYICAGTDYVFWFAKYDGFDFHVAVTTTGHSPETSEYVSVPTIMQELGMDYEAPYR